MANITRGDFAFAYADVDKEGRPIVTFRMNKEGQSKLRQLTAANKHRAMAILVDGEIVSLGTILGEISEAGSIHPNRLLSRTERTRQVDRLVRMMNSAITPKLKRVN